MNLSEVSGKIFKKHENNYIQKHWLRVGIVGSRDFEDGDKIFDVVRTLKEKPKRITIVSGGCPKGADAFAKEAALQFGVPYREFTPEFRSPTVHTVQDEEKFEKKYSPHLFFKRNAELAEYCDLVIGFIPEEYVGDPNNARGTKHTIECAREEPDTKVMVLK